MAASSDNHYDVVIIGAGPAGLAAGLYAARDRYRTLMLEKRGLPGGQIMLTERIENYPGYEFVSGPGLVDQMVRQCKSFGAEIRNNTEVVRLERCPDGQLEVTTSDDDVVTARAVILSPGSDYRQLGVPGEKEFAGSGVSYCGTCDAPFFKGREVVSIGGGNTAIEETIHLAKFCSKVTLIHRRDEFRAQEVLVEELHQTAKERGNIELKLSTVVERVVGKNKVEGVELRDLKTGQLETFRCDGVFIFVGMTPNTSWLDGFVGLDANGFIRCDTDHLRTRVPGVFVAGDCRRSSALQLATACGDGVVASLMLKQYLKDPSWWFHVHEQGATEPVGW